jgi:Protein of unknown function (DUF992)
MTANLGDIPGSYSPPKVHSAESDLGLQLIVAMEARLANWMLAEAVSVSFHCGEEYGPCWIKRAGDRSKPRCRNRSAGALAGEYVGASGDVAFGPGVGANVLVGGSQRSFALQPVSIEGSVALDVTLGLSALQLRYVP